MKGEIMVSELRSAIQTCKDRGEKALIGFIMSSMPDEQTCLRAIMALERGGCDILELGVPFSDPLADGELIEGLHHRGTEMGLNLKSSLNFAKRVRQISKMPIVLFLILIPFIRWGCPNLGKSAGR
jgi:tryptophan synthase alpha chain